MNAGRTDRLVSQMGGRAENEGNEVVPKPTEGLYTLHKNKMYRAYQLGSGTNLFVLRVVAKYLADRATLHKRAELNRAMPKSFSQEKRQAGRNALAGLGSISQLTCALAPYYVVLWFDKRDGLGSDDFPIGRCRAKPPFHGSSFLPTAACLYTDWPLC